MILKEGEIIKRNIILAIIIGTATTYLPIWQWDGTQAAGIISFSIIAWMLIQGTEPDNRGGS
nr:MAG TPA: hypothetical protein [Caudoviricetes sp.]